MRHDEPFEASATRGRLVEIGAKPRQHVAGVVGERKPPSRERGSRLLLIEDDFDVPIDEHEGFLAEGAIGISETFCGLLEQIEVDPCRAELDQNAGHHSILSAEEVARPSSRGTLDAGLQQISLDPRMQGPVLDVESFRKLGQGIRVARHHFLLETTARAPQTYAARRLLSRCMGTGHEMKPHVARNRELACVPSEASSEVQHTALKTPDPGWRLLRQPALEDD